MNPKERKQLLKGEQESFQSFFKSLNRKCFINYDEKLSPENLCVCDVIFPNLLSRYKLIRNYLLCRLAECIPISSFKVWIYQSLGAQIGKGVYIAPRTYLDPFYPELITLEDDVLIGVGVHIFVHEYTQKGFQVGRVMIKKGAVIGACSTIRNSVTIGENALIGMNAFVNQDIADGIIAVGNPAKPMTEDKEQKE